MECLPGGTDSGRRAQHVPAACIVALEPCLATTQRSNLQLLLEGPRLAPVDGSVTTCRNERPLAMWSESAHDLPRLDSALLPQGYSAEAVRELKARQRLLRVDVHGVQARVVTSTRPLRNSNYTCEWLHDLRITAEVELADLLARIKAIDVMIEETTQKLCRRRELGDAFPLRQGQLAQTMGSRRSPSRRVAELQTFLRMLRPALLQPNLAIIRPIAWTADAVAPAYPVPEPGGENQGD